MTELDQMVVRLCCKLRDMEIALSSARQENAGLKARIQELQASQPADEEETQEA